MLLRTRQRACPGATLQSAGIKTGGIAGHAPCVPRPPVCRCLSFVDTQQTPEKVENCRLSSDLPLSGYAGIRIRGEFGEGPASQTGHDAGTAGRPAQQNLDKFLLSRQGRTWDGVPVPNVAVRSLSGARGSFA